MTLRKRELKAAQLVADGELTEEAIAAEIGVARRTLQRWKDRPDFANQVSLIRVETAQALKAEGIRRRENRLEAYQARYDALMQIVEERSKDRIYSFVPGYSTGYMVHDRKFGPEGMTFDVYRVDKQLIDALAQLEKQSAQDTGQWSEKEDPTKLGGRQTNIINTVFVGVPRPDFNAIAMQQVVEIDE